MGKRSRKGAEALDNSANCVKSAKKSMAAHQIAVDPALALLFASSAGPVKAPPRSRYEELPPPSKKPAPVPGSEDGSDEEEAGSGEDDGDLSSVDEDLEDVDLYGIPDEEDGSEEEPVLNKIIEASISKPERKRKRKNDEEDLEGRYMLKLAQEEEREEEERRAERKLKRQKLAKRQGSSELQESGQEASENESEGPDKESEDGSEKAAATTIREVPLDIPVHESLAGADKEALEIEKASRTVFLANVCTTSISSKSAKKTLLTHMGSFLSELPEPLAGKPDHKVESLRFRSTAYAGGGLPKKASFAKQDLMAATTKSTNAYVVYSTAFAAREAVKKLNGTVILDRHLRVDGVAHPAKQDHRRCVFVGNLGFVDDESMLDQGGENERKRSKIPSDIEEGLWRQFGKAGAVESVRVVRDEKTRVGKGFAYVQFEDANAVEAALLFNEKKYPPMLPRVLRVVRAKAPRKTALAMAASQNDRNSRPSKPKIYNPKESSELSSMKGRASKLLGKAGAAGFNKSKGSDANAIAVGMRGAGSKPPGVESAIRTPESIVFEGYRASAKSGRPKDLKMGGGGGGKKKGKPRTRSSARATAWKKGGGK